MAGRGGTRDGKQTPWLFNVLFVKYGRALVGIGTTFAKGCSWISPLLAADLDRPASAAAVT